MGFLTDAALSLFLSKKARENIKQKAKNAPAQKKQKKMTKERAELLRNAQRIHKEQQKILAEISPEDREALAELAIKQLIANNPEIEE